MQSWIQSLFKKLKGKENLLFTTVFIVMVMFRIWLIAGIPNFLVYGPHDDLYFAKAAHYIIHGQWMGPYSQMTLIKTPFYAFFIIASFLAGFPLFLTETIFFLVACVVLFYAVAPLIENRWWRLLLFVIILYIPVSLTTHMNIRVYREFVYLALTLYVISFSIGLLLRLKKGISALLSWSLGLGVSMGAFMLTREEGVWIYPILFLLLSSCLVISWLGKIDQKIIRSALILLPIIIWYLPTLAISSLNDSYYGFRGTTEQLDPDFNRVLSTLDRIKTGGVWHPAVQIPKEARMKAYEVSPMFSLLKEPIENSVPAWNYWEDQALSLKPDWYIAQYPGDGGEISNGHFTWLLRDAVQTQGYYASGKYPYKLYKQIADELEAACDNGKLDCSPPKKIPFVGSIDQRHYPIIMRMFYENISHLLKQDYVGSVSLDINTWTPWLENNDDYKYFEEFIYNPVDVPGIHSGQEAQSTVDGKIDVSIRVLIYKEKIMASIFKAYKNFNLSIFTTSSAGWIFSVLMLISKKRRDEFQTTYLIATLFLAGLFFSRLMTLTIVDATTSAAGIFYSASTYLFIYIFSFLALYWSLSNILQILQKRKTGFAEGTK